MKGTIILIVSLAFSYELAAQTTVTLNNGDDNTTAYDTTGNDTTFTIASGTATQSGVVSGTGSLIKTGAGTVEFIAPNSYTGSTDVQEGTLSFFKPTFSFAEIPWLLNPMTGISVGDSATASLNISGGVFVGNSGTLTLGNTNSGNGTLSISNSLPPIIGSLSNTGDVIVGNAGTGALNITSSGFADITGSLRLGASTGGIGHALVDASFLNADSAIIAEGANSVASLTIDNNGGVTVSGSLELGAGAGSSGQISILNGARLSLLDDASGDALRIGAGAGTVSIDGGTLKHVGTPGTTFTTSVPIAISGNTTFDSAGREMTVHGLVSGTGALELIGGGTLTLTADNTYAGGTTVSAGLLVLGGGGASGSVVGDITNNGFSVTFNRSDDYTFHGVISGTGRLYNEGHIVRLTSAQTYTGDTELRSGFFVLPTDVDQALAATTRVSISSGATLDISNRKLTVAGLTGGGNVYSFGGSDGELTVNTASGPSQNFYGSLGSTYPNFSLVKTGSGTLVLSGSNTYTGTTTIDAGTLIINGSTAAGSVTVSAGGTLGGSGTIGGAVSVAGTLAPGESPGTLNFSDILLLESTSALSMEITGIGFGEFDILNGNGTNTLTLDGTLNLDNTGYSATFGDSIALFTNWATITGTFSSINGTDLGGGLEWDTTNLYTSGQLTVVPEPSSALLLIMTLCAFVMLRRLRFSIACSCGQPLSSIVIRCLLHGPTSYSRGKKSSSVRSR